MDDDLGTWFDEGVRKGATHMLVLADDKDRSFLAPEYVMPGEHLGRAIHEAWSKPPRRVLEVYDLSMDKDTQLREPRAMHERKKKA